MNNEMKKFEVGRVYQMRAIGDHNCVWQYTVTARTASTVKLFDGKQTISRRIVRAASAWRNAETVYPLGQYSMAPTLSADKVA